ncbi:MAG: hypothetical protein GWN71_02345, partial [Gammaproteobacteria bacterium]|nr:hypothetical protein [Gemmatimonadota bacterium]NIU72448.1 hypothetical protein [Gammaproteobacteria bacterium]
VPFWIGWDLWVGAEFLLHLGLYSGIALALRAADGRPLSWILAGVAFGFAYLARPEALLVFGLAVAAAVVLAASRRTLRAAVFPLALLAGFAP